MGMLKDILFDIALMFGALTALTGSILLGLVLAGLTVEILEAILSWL